MRTLRLKKPPMTGPDVKALQKLLKSKGFKVVIDGVYSSGCADVVLKAKKTIPGYPFWLLNRMAGGTFTKLLTAYKPPRPKPTTPRSRFLALLRWGIIHEPQIHYPPHDLNARPVPVHLKIHTLPFTTDCSGIGILFAKWGKAPDPSGYGFSGAGNTTSFYNHCKHITKAELKPGDIVQFDDEHATYVLEPGSDPLLFSHGMEAGPIAIRQSAETRYHQNVPIYYLRFLED